MSAADGVAPDGAGPLALPLADSSIDSNGTSAGGVIVCEPIELLLFKIALTPEPFSGCWLYNTIW